MAKKGQSNFMKELSSWAKPTKGIVFTPGKAIYSLAKTAFRHPYVTAAAYFALKPKKGKFAKGLKLGQGPYAGTKWAKGGKWML